MIDSSEATKTFGSEDTENTTKTLLKKYQTIISELTLCAEQDSELTLQEFLEKLELD